MPAAPNPPALASPHRGPVILDTDIGDDMDDTWALGLLLKSPELDLKLVLGDYGRSHYRAQLLAKFLQTTGHADIPVGIGLDGGSGVGAQAPWVANYELKSYPGKVFPDGVQALIDTIMSSPEPVTLICIGPVHNIATALAREPRIAAHAKFVGMDGSIRIGYGGSTNISAEWNVVADVKSCQRVFTAPWRAMTITPLDTCGRMQLTGDRYQRVLHSHDPVAMAVIDNYRIWSHHAPTAENHSSTLFDTVAVYLAIDQQLCQMQRLNIRVTDDGFTRIDPTGHPMFVATAWNNLDGYADFLVNRLSK